MKKLLAVLFVLASSTAFADNYVRPYVRSDGTYVEGHYKSQSNSTRYDNYSSQGNSNPYTGQKGSQRNELSDTPTYNKNYGNPSYGNPYDSGSRSKSRGGW